MDNRITVIPVDSNWLIWKQRMEHMISDRELMEYLDGTTVLTDRAEDTAMTAIIMAIGDFPASIIRCCKTPKEARDKQVGTYEKNTMIGKMHLCEHFFTMS